MPHTPRRVRDSDVTWIITLWRALHGTDAGLEDVAAEVTAIFAQYLPGCPEVRFDLDRLPRTLPGLRPDVSACRDTPRDDAWQVGTEEDQDRSGFELALDDERARETAADGFREDQGENSWDHSADGFRLHHYYFKFKGRIYCFELPALTCSPAAA